MRPESIPEFVRRGFYESCEDRLALTADPIGHHWLESSLDGALDQHRDVAPTLPAAHSQTGLNHVRDTYGFRGAGQTVAVIDSGIAYTHQALGAGFGQGYRVVGGWDFTEENDGNPYDDGPYGFHGTHVAGIIGSDDTRHTGVAPDVDLVALRVFNDQKQGYLSWVEQALQWVHTHRNAFENPITTVNLSLGTSWNSNNVPMLAALEDEFAQLKADGIFVAVSAGNSFQEFGQQPGVSYPAASPYVVPVASVDGNGNLSSFSQRNGRVLAAPGEYIGSSVPDHVFGADGQHNDFGYASGTSMAAPYVAGASVLLREAMQFLGYTDVTQDTLYDHFFETADVIHDSITGLGIHRINLQNAFDALMPADEDAAGACSLAFVDGNASMAGMINRLGDIDTFTFTAAQAGEAVFSLGETNGAAVSWQTLSGQTLSGNELRFQVTAGQSYTVSLAAAGGLAHYSFDAAIESAVIDLGAVDFDSFGTFTVNGEAVYRMSATAGGFFSVLASWNANQGSAELKLYNEQQQLLATVASSTGNTQIDALVGGGEVVYLRVAGNAEFQLTAANLVTFAGSQATVAGTSGNDTVTLSAGAAHRLSVNGFSYEFSAASTSGVTVHGSGGVDQIVITGGAGNDTATVGRGSATMAGSGYAFAATGFEEVTIHGGGGTDLATLYDTAGDDTFVATSASAQMTGTGFNHRVQSFSRVNAYASSGNDTAMLYDSTGDDVFGGVPHYSFMYGSGFYNYAGGFDRVNAYAINGGNDSAHLYDSAGDDVYGGVPEYSFMYGNGYYNYARGFERVNAYATAGGNDLAFLYDSAGNDTFIGTSTYSSMIGDGFFNYTRGFERVNAYASSGNDLAHLYDSAGDDEFAGSPEFSYMIGPGFHNHVRGFDRVNAYAINGGNDVANLADSAGDDVFGGLHDYSFMYGSGYHNYVRGFESVNAYSRNGGNDLALFYASEEVDTFLNTATYSMQYGTGYRNYARGFASTRSYGDANDRAYFYNLGSQDTVYGRNNYLTRDRAGLSLRCEGTGSIRFYCEGEFTPDLLAVDYYYQRL